MTRMPHTGRWLAGALICVLTVAAAPGSDAGAQALKLELLTQGPSRPTGIHSAGDGSGRLFLLSKEGTIWIYHGEGVPPSLFLDIDAIVHSGGVERGLHGLAFHPDYESNGFFYVMYTNNDSDNVLSRWSVSEDPDVADPESEAILWLIDQPDQYHNCSQLQFGLDGYLYIGCGDGGFVGDPDNRAQNLSEVLGKIHRIDVDGGFPYAIPTNNPFIDEPGARPEIWAFGLRNPWRFSFDRLTGDLFIGDVGQFSWEEVNFQPGDSIGGENYGWRAMEGNHCYNPSSGCWDPSFTLPIFEHAHGFGQECAVAGGYVYRGSRFPRFQGIYFYSDWCTGGIWAGAQVEGEWGNLEVLDSDLAVTTFGEDDDGELYVADDNDGRVYRLVDPIPFCDVEMPQDSYTNGEIVMASAMRLVNLGPSSVTVRLRAAIFPPAGGPVVLVDLGADGSFSVPSGADLDAAPQAFFTVGPETPRGTYGLRCRLETWPAGQVLIDDTADFEVQ